MGILVKIVQAEQLIGLLLVPTLELARKLESLFRLLPDVQVNIVNLSKEALAADDAVDAEIAAWRKRVGLPSLPPSAT